MRILISAGPTREALDPVRFLSNRSTGKMGYSLCEAALEHGHCVTLVSGPVSLTPPPGLEKFIPVVSASEMAEAVKGAFPEADLTIMCAAVADYRPVRTAVQKIHKKEGIWTLELERTEDILFSLGQMKKPGQILAGFAAETEDLESSAQAKLVRKNLDWIIANEVRSGQAFGSDWNAVVLFSAAGTRLELPRMTKKEIACKILEELIP